MQVFRDLDMVEQLSSGLPRILESYPKECFNFSENFLRMTFSVVDQVSDQASKEIVKFDYSRLMLKLSKFLYDVKKNTTDLYTKYLKIANELSEEEINYPEAEPRGIVFLES
jgi:ATP-dependent DNA helicase RecG